MLRLSIPSTCVVECCYDAHNEVACLMLGSMTPELHIQFENYSPYEMLQELRSMFEKQARVESYGLILNDLTCDFAGFMRNYNMHNMKKTIGELHAMLIEYEKGLPKKAKTPQVMAIRGGKIQKANKRSLKAKSKGKVKGKGKDKQGYIPKPKNPKHAAKKHPSKDDTCHHCKEGKKRIEKLQQEGLLKSTDDESFDHCVSCLSGKMTRKSFPRRLQRATDLFGIIHTDVCGSLRHVSRQDRGGEYISQEFKDYLKAFEIVQQLTPPYTPQHNGVSERRNRTLLDMVSSMMNLTTLSLSFWDYALESATCILNMVPTKKVDSTPYELCEIPIEVEGFEPPKEEVILIRRFERTHRAPDRLCLNVEAEDHSLGDLNEPTSYKAAMLDSESNKWIDAMNAEIQSMMDNMVRVLVDLPPGCKTVGTKGYTQLYEVDYEETFSPVADIRAIRILISIAAFYDYEIWQMDVKTAFLNGYLDEDIYI
nr:hypothetical protein [Tanacetum cinerariifolium]